MLLRSSLALLCLVLILGQQCASTPVPDDTPLPTYVVMQTSKGQMVIKLNKENAPEAARNFVRLVERNYYNNCIVHEALPGTWIALGSYRKDMTLNNPATLVSEVDNGLQNRRGAVAIYSPEGVSEGIAVILINLADNSQLNYIPEGKTRTNYTVIGSVVDGLFNADIIAEVDTETSSAGLPHMPVEQVTLNSIKPAEEYTPAPEPPPTTDDDDETPTDDDDTPPDDDEPADETFTTTDSGLQYRDISEGDGDVVTEADTIRAFYTGRLDDENGEIFDTTEGGDARQFSLRGVIAGWREGLGNYDMRAGGKRILIIPPELGYGEMGSSSGSIPPNATLWFEVEVVEIVE